MTENFVRKPQSKVFTCISTGLQSLDKVLQGVLPGDNIVWQVDSIDDYLPFLQPFYTESIRSGRYMIYLRFADHSPLIPKQQGVFQFDLNPSEGFESFISAIFSIIEKYGVGACYVFDCLSDLAVDWYSDRMLGNFFMLVCPYLYDFDTVAYFSLLRDHHMEVATKAIHDTAQVVIDIFRKGEKIFIQPLKVFKRHSPTLYMLHAWEQEEFKPVASSAIISEIHGSVVQPWLAYSGQRSDLWIKKFILAQQYINQMDSGKNLGKDAEELLDQLLRMVLTRDLRLLELAKKYLDLTDMVQIGKRMIGTGLIGGKSAGMLVARAIVAKRAPHLKSLLEVHDSFYIGSDVFYTYLVQNKCWWIRRKLILSGELLDGSEEVRQRMLEGEFPEDILEQFSRMIDYFGQSPIIVRSSSLLEDAYGNAFSGKYESVFCANQGTPQHRLNNFINAVRTVYASTMSKDALLYRAHWGLLEHDEQMALLVQRVSGQMSANLFFPHVSGVGFSFNPYVWNSAIDPKAGVLRLVFGLGTRAVDRYDDDYTRVVALNAPLKRPEATFDEVCKYAQRRVDVINLKRNMLETVFFDEIPSQPNNIPMDIFASCEEQQTIQNNYYSTGQPSNSLYVLTFDKLLSATGFVPTVKEILGLLQQAYRTPVDIEFACNFIDNENFRINLLQCRPFQLKGKLHTVKVPTDISAEKIILRTNGPIIGNSRDEAVGMLIYVVPQSYSGLTMSARYSVARLIGQLTHLEKKDKGNGIILLIGPGRWGTTTPSLGVPVSFAEINTVSAICEIAAMHEGLVPDVSLGTHFFNDLVEMDMLYMAMYPNNKGCFLNNELLFSKPNNLAMLMPDAAQWSETVRLLDVTKSDNLRIWLTVDSMSQQGICYIV